MNDYFVTQYLSQQCLGYSADFQETYWRDVCECSDGITRTLFITTREGGMVSMSDYRPLIARPIEAMTPSGL